MSTCKLYRKKLTYPLTPVPFPSAFLSQDFSLKNPNRVRSLISAFANSNLPQFHAIDGRGYQLVTDVIIAVDKINPQVKTLVVCLYRTIISFIYVR